MFDPKHIKAVAVDCDGTLINSHETLSARTREAVQALLKTGREIYMVTGRSTEAAAGFAQEAGIPEFIITYNGAVLWDMQKKSKVCEFVIDAEIAKGLSAMLRDTDVSYIFYDNDSPYYENLNPIMERYLKRISGMGLVPHRALISDMAMDSTQKCIVFGEDDVIRALHKNIAARYGESLNMLVTRPYEHNQVVDLNYTFIEIMDKRVDKGIMLAELAKIRGFTIDNVMAFGDDINDIGMLKAAGWGVAMGNGREEVKQASKDVTLWHDEDGIAVYIEKYLL